MKCLAKMDVCFVWYSLLSYGDKFCVDGCACWILLQQMPTFQFYFEGELVSTLLGADKAKLEAMLKELSAKDSSEPEPKEAEIVEEKRGLKAFFKMLFRVRS